ncbi:SPOR domain-containing protein, partial [Alteromonas sp. 14N.309.X.WAT.G.H12]|uniref:SPOR domain-containing protein n=1 Tax=Alteromonas sp. 14N.309.X.WAT.G.H12 TaxID=3120824 RepID=UPI002FD26C66
YAAAKKLGYHQNGTTKVKLEVIYFDENNQVTVGKGPTVSYEQYAGLTPQPDDTGQAASDDASEDIYIQVAAVSDEARAHSVSTILSNLYNVPAITPLVDNIYKLRLGPLKDKFKVKLLLEDLKKNGYPGAYQIHENL